MHHTAQVFSEYLVSRVHSSKPYTELQNSLEYLNGTKFRRILVVMYVGCNPIAHGKESTSSSFFVLKAFAYIT